MSAPPAEERHRARLPVPVTGEQIAAELPALSADAQTTAKQHRREALASDAKTVSSSRAIRRLCRA